MKDTEYAIAVSIGFNEFLDELKSSKDKWIVICAVFLEVINDSLQFVHAYCMGDLYASISNTLSIHPSWKQ